MIFDQLSKAKDLKQKIYFTLLALIVYRIGSYIPLPGINPEVLANIFKSQSIGIAGMMDMFSGGGFSRMSIFAMNLAPYISSSIIVQLVSTFYGPFQALRKEGEMGKKKLNQYTRYLTVALALLQSYGLAAFIEKTGMMSDVPAILISSWLFKISTVMTITGSVLFLMWLGEQITSRGIGNGTSVLIYAGIIAGMPSQLLRLFMIGRQEGTYYILPLLLAAAVVAFGFVVFMEKAQLKVPIQYPKRSAVSENIAGQLPSHLPLKINMAGVMPPIFAQSIMTLPAMIVMQLFAASSFSTWFMFFLRPGHPLNMAIFSFLIIFFSFVYTQMQFDPKDSAENLKKSQAYIPGIRPGQQTEDYLRKVLYRLSMIGALYLTGVCVIPQYLLAKTSLPFYIGGTTILIIVSVTIETISQVQSYLFSHQYQGLLSRRMRRQQPKPIGMPYTPPYNR